MTFTPFLIRLVFEVATLAPNLPKESQNCLSHLAESVDERQFFPPRNLSKQKNEQEQWYFFKFSKEF